VSDYIIFFQKCKIRGCYSLILKDLITKLRIYSIRISSVGENLHL